MASNINLIVFPTKDLDKSKQFLSTYLGAEPYADSAYYVGFKLDNLEVGLDPNADKTVSYIETEDIENSLDTLEKAGAEIVMDPKDVGGGLKVAQVSFEGNLLGLRQPPK